jgi:hypothetical protein
MLLTTLPMLGYLQRYEEERKEENKREEKVEKWEWIGVAGKIIM